FIIIQGLYLDVRFSGCCSPREAIRAKSKAKSLFIFLSLTIIDAFVISIFARQFTAPSGDVIILPNNKKGGCG
ncbi:hypothetical protein, partial [Cloacibacillus porcorum]|uniref:hypothetical protein n=1 Tax=Cloacibacillus porcorum TaxID=1197717 RepID=UPI003F11554B